MLDGVGTAIGSALGVGPLLGRLAALALVVVVVVRLVRGVPVSGRAVACFGAIVFEYAILGLLRAQLFDSAAEYSRYAYLSGIVALLGLASLVGPISLPERGPRRLATVVGLASVTTLALVWNVWLLRDGRDLFADRAAETRATIVVATGDLGPGVDPDTDQAAGPDRDAAPRGPRRIRIAAHGQSRRRCGPAGGPGAGRGDPGEPRQGSRQPLTRQPTTDGAPPSAWPAAAARWMTDARGRPPSTSAGSGAATGAA